MTQLTITKHPFIKDIYYIQQTIKTVHINHYITGTGGSLPPEGGLFIDKCSKSLICTRSFLISPFWISIIFSSWFNSSFFWLSFSVISSIFPWFCCLRMTPKAVSKSWTVVLDIFNSLRRSFISLIRVTFSYNHKKLFNVNRFRCYVRMPSFCRRACVELKNVFNSTHVRLCKRRLTCVWRSFFLASNRPHHSTFLAIRHVFKTPLNVVQCRSFTNMKDTGFTSFRSAFCEP